MDWIQSSSWFHTFKLYIPAPCHIRSIWMYTWEMRLWATGFCTTYALGTIYSSETGKKEMLFDLELNTKYSKYPNGIPSGWINHKRISERLCTRPLITIIAGVRGAIHEHSINKRANQKILKSIIKTLMKNIHQNVIKYLMYFVLNKRKLDNKQIPIPLPHKLG
jgi:hypothetical protein